MENLWFCSLNKLERRVPFLFRHWHVPGYSLREALTALLHVLIKAVLCVRPQKSKAHGTNDLKICLIVVVIL